MEPVNGARELKEMRRAYHDRIADLRERSLTVLRCAISGTEQTVAALPEGDLSVADAVGRQAKDIAGVAADVDAEVVSLLALESPVARDLRVILVSRDVTQLGLLCVGLALTLAQRVGSAGRVADPGLRHQVEAVGTSTAALLRLAEGAWVTLDPDLAAGVMSKAGAAREAHVEFFRALLALKDVPMDVALDLGFSSRAFDRLADHAVEIAERVLFAVRGASRTGR